MKKLMNKKGFTLAELLIVVAIIGVLTVVAVPVFTTQLAKSKLATDEANERAAKAAATALYLDDSSKTGTAYFDAKSGKITLKVPAGYGKGTVTKTSGSTSTPEDHTGWVIQCSFTTTATPTLTWVNPTGLTDGDYNGTL